MKPTKKQDELTVVLLKAKAFNLIEQRANLEQQMQLISQQIQKKVQEIKKLEAKPNEPEDKGTKN